MQEFFDNLLGVPGLTDIIAQTCGIIGMAISILSFQCKSNKIFFLMLSGCSTMFILNFLLIGAFGSAFFNVVGLARGVLFMKNDKKKWKLILIEMLFIAAFIISAILDHSVKQLILTSLTGTALLVITVFMWQGNARKIRTVQICCASPAWLVNNFINFSLGGILCEIFNIVSSFIFLLRTRKIANIDAQIQK